MHSDGLLLQLKLDTRWGQTANTSASSDGAALPETLVGCSAPVARLSAPPSCLSIRLAARRLPGVDQATARLPPPPSSAGM